MTGSSIYDYGYTTPSNASAPRIRTSVTGLGIAAMVLLAFDATLGALSVWFMARRLTQLGRVLTDAAAVDPGRLQRTDEALRQTTGWFVIFSVATAVVFICWFRVARNNAEAYGRGPGTLGVWWSVGGWFVPVAMLIIPFVVARDIYRGTMAGHRAEPGGGRITGWWWGGYVAFWITGIFAAAEVGHADDVVIRDDHLRDLHTATGAGMLAQAVGVVAALLAIAYVGVVTKAQYSRFRDGGTQQALYGYGSPYSYGYGYGYGAPVQDPIPGTGVQDAVPGGVQDAVPGGVQDAIPSDWQNPPN